MRLGVKMFIFSLIAWLSSAVHGMEGRLMRNPDVCGDKIVFEAEDDLWTVPVNGGAAVRLTSHPGAETLPKFSPDGKWIAFTGSYDGGTDVYVIPSNGGEPNRLTCHPAEDRVVDWFPDGESILFTSNRAVNRGVYRVSIRGGFQEPVAVDRIRHASFSPDGKRLAFTRSDADLMNWRGYKGGDQPDIWIADLGKNTFEKVTDYRGYDINPMWRGGSIYFLSDRDGPMNLYALSLSDRRVTRKTFHRDWDAEEASIGGDAIVYRCGGDLWIFDAVSEKSRKIPVEIPSDRWLMRDTYVNPGDYAQELAPSKDGKTVAVQARGDVYLLDARNVVNLTDSPESNEIVPAPSPDGRWVAFFSDRTGNFELYLSPRDKKGGWIRLTDGFDAWPYHPVWSPDSKKILFGDNRYRLFYADRETKRLVKIDSTPYQRDNEIYWETAEYDWSPDSKWVAYSKCEANMNSSIFLYGLESGKIARVTDDRFDDAWPSFDKSGGLLYFLSLRNFDPLLDPFMDNHVNADMSAAMAVQLRAGERPPFDADDPDSAQGGTGEKAFGVDTAGIGDRIFATPVPAGTYSRLQACKDGFFFLSREDFGFPGWSEFLHPKSVTDFSLNRFNVKTKRTGEIMHGLGYYNASGDGSRIAYLAGSVAGVITPEGESIPGDGALDWRGFRQKIETGLEYRQILRTVWNQVRLFFYDPSLHGLDWEAVRKKYEAMIPAAGNRSDLNALIGRMVGELGVSHEYVLNAGDESRTPRDRAVGVGLLGADFEPDRASGRVRFGRIVKGRNWDNSLRNPLESPEAGVRQGDYLLSIDGSPVTAEEDVFSHLVDKAGKRVRLAFNSRPDTAGARTAFVKTLLSEDALREAEWVEDNYRRVREASRGRVGYLHLSDMDEQGFREFEQGFRSERFRDALIIDVRGNGGGFISWFVLDKLERRLAFYTQTRGFEPMRYPHGVHPGPLVFLCDENTGSDGEIFIEMVKKFRLGPVIGTDTWGGLVGINNLIPAADGALVTQSNVGFFDPSDNRWIVENKGARPDSIVENRPDEILKGQDRQLEKAVETALELLRRNPTRPILSPPFPNHSK
jgi:tricorn protease